MQSTAFTFTDKSPQIYVGTHVNTGEPQLVFGAKGIEA
jgi:hypothetical protein